MPGSVPPRRISHHFVEKGPYQTDYLSVNTIKLFADGALGSRGARMIEPYSDDPGNLGLFVTPLEILEKHCRKAYENQFMLWPPTALVMQPTVKC